MSPRSPSPRRRGHHHLDVPRPSASAHSLLTGASGLSPPLTGHHSGGSSQRSSQLSALRQLARSFEAERMADRLEEGGWGGGINTSSQGVHRHDEATSPVSDHRPHSALESFGDPGSLDDRKEFQAEEDGQHRRHHRYEEGKKRRKRSRSRLAKMFGGRPESAYEAVDAGGPSGSPGVVSGLGDEDERTPLLGLSAGAGERGWRKYLGPWARRTANRPPKSAKAQLPYLLSCLCSSGIGWLIIQSLPAVVLGLILNLLDALSYGIIIFPTTSHSIPIHSATQSGISMFLASTVISQIVFALGGSAFKGANGSMMIEVMPFLHIMVKQIEGRLVVPGEETDTKGVLATIMVAYAMSTVVTGLVFLGLGVFKLGNLIQFFPRHILVG
ncbi:hypothetical protein HDU67_010150, partial [Dinochytrium kinnereticum]